MGNRGLYLALGKRLLLDATGTATAAETLADAVEDATHNLPSDR